MGAKKRLAEDSRRHRGAMEGICPSEIAQPFGGGDGLTVRTTVTKVKGPDLRFDSQQRHPIFGSLHDDCPLPFISALGNDWKKLAKSKFG